MYDICIIGAGIIGTSIARELARFKLRIVLLEKEEEPSFGVSKSNSGIVHAGTQNPVFSLKARLCVQGNALTRKQAAELGLDFKEVGQLIVAFTEGDIARLLTIKKEGEALGVEGTRIVNKNWLTKNEPNLSSKAIAALYVPSAGIISPYRWVYALSENAVRNGVEVRTGAAVRTIASSGKNGSRVFELETPAGRFRSRYVINCAGLFADEISSMAGASGFEIRPRKGEEFLLDKKQDNLTDHLIFPLPSPVSKGVIVIKTADGNPMIGPSADDVTAKDDLSTTDEGLASIFASASRMVPAVNQDDIIAYFAGLRPVAGEDFIIRHEDSVPGFINVAGIQSPGLTAAPAIALYVRDILKKRGLPLKKKLMFRNRRKKGIHLFEMPAGDIKKMIRRDSRYGDMVCRCENVSAAEIHEAIRGGAVTMDGIKFRTRAQAGRCHGSFCTTRIMKMLAESKGIPATKVTKRGQGSEIVFPRKT